MKVNVSYRTITTSARTSFDKERLKHKGWPKLDYFVWTATMENLLSILNPFCTQVRAKTNLHLKAILGRILLGIF